MVNVKNGRSNTTLPPINTGKMIKQIKIQHVKTATDLDVQFIHYKPLAQYCDTCEEVRCHKAYKDGKIVCLTCNVLIGVSTEKLPTQKVIEKNEIITINIPKTINVKVEPQMFML